MYRGSTRSPPPLMTKNSFQRKQANIKSLGKRQQIILKRFFGKMKELVTMNYRTTSNFQEEWQKENESTKNDEEVSKYMLKQTDTIYMVYVIVTLIAHIAIAWFMSVKEIYKIGGDDSTKTPIVIFVAIAWMVIEVLDILVQLNTTKMVGERQILSRRATFTIYLNEHLVSDLVNIVIADSLIVFTVNTVPSVLLTIISIWTLIRKIIQKKQAFKTYSNDVQLLGQFNLIQLLIFALIMGHIFSLVLYVSAFIGGYPLNWLKKNSIDNSPWYVQYIYALYWSITTMTTVGYGDIAATNPAQIFISIFVQILGCAIFGYMINIIGMVLSDMRKAKETLQQQILITKKLGKCFNLSKNLTYQVMNYIQNNHKTDESFTVDDETKLFGRLNTRLKNQILLETNQRVLKKCVLFLTQFTRNLQNQIALKLIKKIFQPNQILSDEKNNSIFLLDRGEVEVMIQKRHQNKLIFKTIKDLRDSGNRAGLNIYGMLGFFTDKQRNITGKSRAFTVAYQLKKADFMEVLQDNPFDAEKFFQIRDRINLLPIPEEVQGSLLTNSKQHYCPNKYVIIKKHTYSAKASRNPTKRKNMKMNVFNSYILSQGKQNISMDEKLLQQSKYSIGGLIQVGRGTQKALDLYRSDKMMSAKNIKKQITQRIDYQNIKHYDNYFPSNNFMAVTQKFMNKKRN